MQTVPLRYSSGLRLRRLSALRPDMTNAVGGSGLRVDGTLYHRHLDDKNESHYKLNCDDTHAHIQDNLTNHLLKLTVLVRCRRCGKKDNSWEIVRLTVLIHRSDQLLQTCGTETPTDRQYAVSKIQVANRTKQWRITRTNKRAHQIIARKVPFCIALCSGLSSLCSSGPE